MKDTTWSRFALRRWGTRLGTAMALALLSLAILCCGLQQKAFISASLDRPNGGEPGVTRPVFGNEAGLQASPGGSIPLIQTIVSGTISTDTIWSGDVLVEDSVTVETGATLTVQPGTQVKFKHYRGYQEPEKRLGLYVLGTLIVTGTAENPVYFTSDADDPQNGDWSMIHINQSSDSLLQYCVIEFGQQGLNVWGGAPQISHCVIRWHNWEGLYFESYAAPTIEYCHIVENGYNGLAAEQFNTIVMDYCEIERSGTHGVHIDASTGEVRRSRVHDNHASGLSVDDSGELRALGVALYNNQDCGIAIGEGNNSVITSNLSFSGNWGGDICGSAPIATTTSPYTIPASIDIGFTPAMTHALGYIPGDPISDTYMYVYPDDETRRIVRRIGEGMGLTWSLAWDGEHIWTATLWGTVSKLDPSTGIALEQFSVPEFSQPWGMTYDGEYLWVVDFAEKSISKLNPATKTIAATYPTPDPQGGCKGITWDGSYLYVMGWTSSDIYKMDRAGHLIDSIPLDHGGGGGIAWDGQYFWVPGGGRILKYNSQGHLVGWIYAASEGTWDMTWDGQYLWASQRTNENWPDAKIFALEILDDHDRPLYVDGRNPSAGSGSPADPYRTIAQAVSAAGAGNDILVAQGTYTENVAVDKEVRLWGGYASYTSPLSWTRNTSLYETIIDGNQSGSVLSFEGFSGDAVLDGFTITGGKADEAGGGISIEGGSPTIRSCRVQGNAARGQGEWGGGAILISGGGSVVISNTLIISNTASAGGASGLRIGDSSVTLINSLIAHNTGQPTIHANNAVLTLTHVTIADNDYPHDSVFLNSSQAAIFNSILWEEAGPDIRAEEGGAYSLSYSNMEDGVATGAGNISADPRFVDAPHNDFRLQADSPCIDKGTATGAPATDIAGNPRDAMPDMGAYEWSVFGVYLPTILKGS